MDLETYLQARKITLGDFADSVGVTVGCISNYKNKIRRPRSKIMEKIVAITNGQVTPNDFFDLKATKGRRTKRTSRPSPALGQKRGKPCK